MEKITFGADSQGPTWEEIRWNNPTMKTIVRIKDDLRATLSDGEWSASITKETGLGEIGKTKKIPLKPDTNRIEVSDYLDKNFPIQ